MKKLFFPFFFIFTLFSLITLASSGANDSALHTKVSQWMGNASGLRFLENKGQMMDMPVRTGYPGRQRKAANNLLFKVGAGGVDLYITTTGLSYVFTKMEKHKKTNTSAMQNKFAHHCEDDSLTIQYCRADLILAGADIRKENIVKEDESSDRTDYYYGDVCPDGILNVHSYGKVTIKNIYPGIDWVLHSGKSGLKYDFIVHPGAAPSLIRLKYRWTDAPQLQDNGSIKISTPMGNITEGTPASYSNGAQVPTAYTIKDSEIHFNVGNYNSTKPLIIDPTLVWATYYGGTGVENVTSIQDDGTNVWLTGSTTSTNFPTLNPGGSAYFQGTLAGVENVYVLEFSISGVLKWATYYGGSTYDIGESIYSDGINVWVTGQTESPNFPELNPGGGAYYQNTLAGKYNAFILKFSNAGMRQWATYYGGNGMDGGGSSIYSDGTNVWVTGVTQSTNFPTLNPGGNTYFQGALAGRENVFILKFNAGGVCKWATYYGGSQNDGGISIQSDGRHVWVGGTTRSANFPTLNPGGNTYFQGNIGTPGRSNPFILKFDTAGVRKWATYFGGNDSLLLDEEVNSIFCDGTSVWVAGATGSSNMPVLNPGGGAYFQGKLASINQQNIFIAQFDTTGALKWSTYYGGKGWDIAYSIQSDHSNIWVAGGTSSSDFPLMKSSCGYYDSVLGISGCAPFLLEFTTSGVRQWATYYGSDKNIYATYTCTDGTNVFMAGDATANNYPTKNPGGGAYYVDTVPGGASEENVFIGKFIISTSGVSSNVSICKGSSTTLSASGGISYSWSPSTGLSATNIPNPVANPTVTTTYTVTIVDTGACGGTFKDSVKVTIDTLNFKNIRLSHDTTICHGNSVTLHASGAPTYSWSTGATTSSTTINNDTTTTTYTVAISNGACIKDTGIMVTVTPKINGLINGNLSICNGHSTTLYATGGTSYQWSTGSNASSISVSPSSNTTYSVIITQGPCSDTAFASVSVGVSPAINACCDSSIEPGQQVQLDVTGTGNDYSYSWVPNYDLSCINCPDPSATPQQTTTYMVIAINDSTGCISLGYATIDVSCGSVFIPDAFTPGAAHNNILYVRGNCIASILFEVFDRWGNRVFESTNLAIGWDGNHDGKPMNTDTYVWLLKAVSKTGTTIKKSGTVTLIR